MQSRFGGEILRQLDGGTVFDGPVFDGSVLKGRVFVTCRRGHSSVRRLDFEGAVHVLDAVRLHFDQHVPQTTTGRGLVNSIEVSPHDPATVYVVVMKYKDGDLAPYAWRSTNYGRSWSSIADGLPEDHFVRVIREDPERAGLLFAGMERGLYISLNGGSDWRPLQSNLPIVPITDLMVRRNDLVLATQGRAFWVYDDLSALRQFDAEHESAAAHLYAPASAYRMAPTPRGYGGGESTAPTAPQGAVLYYSLAEALDFESEEAPELQIEILNGAGEVIRTLETDAKVGAEGSGKALSAQKGLNRAVWDLTTERTTKIDYDVVFGAGPRDKSIGGYHVAPGTYTVRLSFGEDVQEQSVEVIWDPIHTYDDRKIAEQQAFLAESFGMIDALYERIAGVQQIQKQVELRKTIAEEADETELVEAADSLLEALDSWQKSVSTPERETFQDVLNFAPEIDSFLVNVYQAADSAVLGLTRGQTDRLDDLRPVWQEAIAGWDKLMAEALPAFNRVAGPAVAVPELDQP